MMEGKQEKVFFNILFSQLMDRLIEILILKLGKTFVDVDGREKYLAIIKLLR